MSNNEEKFSALMAAEFLDLPILSLSMSFWSWELCSTKLDKGDGGFLSSVFTLLVGYSIKLSKYRWISSSSLSCSIFRVNFAFLSGIFLCLLMF